MVPALLRLVASLALALGLASSAQAQTWPARPVHILTAFTPGGLADVIARLLAPRYEALLGKSFIVENRAGAGGIMGTDYVAKASPDGYTLLVTTTAVHGTGPNLYPSLPYDPVADFTHISLLARAPLFLFVNADDPYPTLAAFIDAAKAKPGSVNFGSPGPGSLGHLTGELISLQTGIRMTHIPYKGALPAQNDLLSHQLQAMVDNLPGQAGMVKAGRLRALAITTEQRLDLLPDVPTFRESGYPTLLASAWVGLCAPAGLPSEIVARLHATTRAILEQPDLRARLVDVGLAADGSLTPDEDTAFVRREIARWGEVVRAAGVKLE
ncbi:MAG: tripartite tricarboxylate transporter substrate binding protein [Pseudomonadota bacterium]